MNRYTQQWNPFLPTPGIGRGFGAATWTDYAPPASWAGYGVDPVTERRIVGGIAGGLGVLYGLGTIGAFWALTKKRLVPAWAGYTMVAFGAIDLLVSVGAGAREATRPY